MRTSFSLALLIAFVDSIGIGLIYPVFSSLFFDPSIPILLPDTSTEMRGLWLSLHLSLMPLALFFSSPVWGAISDRKGRKNPLQISLSIGLIGYIIAICGIFFHAITLLLFSRILIGISSGNGSVAQAAIADLSAADNKVKHFGMYAMALGMGFALGPFFGGVLSAWNFHLPFFFAGALIAIILVLNQFFFKETNKHFFNKKITWAIGLTQLKQAFQLKGVRVVFLVSFLHNFAWCYFYQFIPIYLTKRFDFTPTLIGYFYGIAGVMYAVSAGLLIRPFIRRFNPETLFFGGNLLAGVGIIAMTFLPSSIGMWPLMILTCYFVAFVAPSSTTLVSNSAGAEAQGEVLSILASVNAIAPILSPFFSGSLITTYPAFPAWVGGTILFFASLIVFMNYRKQLFKLP